MVGQLIGSTVGLGLGLAGMNELSDAERKAMDLIQQSISEYNAIGIPQEEALRLSLEKYKSAGILTPKLESVINQGGSSYEGIQTDERLKDAEMQSLDELRNIYEGGGATLTDQANFEGAMDDVAQAERGSREAILLDAAQRGSSTGGVALAAQLANQQGSADRAHDVGLRRAADAEERALEAIRTSGELAGGMQGREFSQKAQVASAKDAIAAANANASRATQQRNVSSINDASAANLAERQRMMNSNVDIGNEEQRFNKNLPQQTFENQLTLTGAKAGARGQAADATLAAGKGKAGALAGMGQAVAGAGTAYDEYGKKRKV